MAAWSPAFTTRASKCPPKLIAAGKLPKWPSFPGCAKLIILLNQLLKTRIPAHEKTVLPEACKFATEEGGLSEGPPPLTR